MLGKYQIESKLKCYQLYAYSHMIEAEAGELHWVLGEGCWVGGSGGAIKAKFNVEVQPIGHHNPAKGGIRRNGTKNLTKINQGPREKYDGCVVYSFIISLQSFGSSSV